jgi:hypothetical protein
MPRISVILTAEEDARFTTYCEQTGHKKSTLIARLVREHLDKEGFLPQATVPRRDQVPPRQVRRSRRRK